ncbi:ATP-binding cassette domain-containing protein [Alteromonas sp. 1_MG-2023]|uniref:ATP-binding cassette domain-containing protein n=1 Tax=Alteromonas sp. 1_MG-2023 TaxID=3062669 RepID=UPI0026E1E89C|nr:ATP-binding cassette domain-containing protein [Alteromonas sp. 1_MG-2023]MDO6569213.1 ATP-binding cassette domain-containing protein [Alteromonas sp. 1_MG-2023]
MEFNVALTNRINAKAVLPESMQVIGITGPSGAGKSSLLRSLAGFEPQAKVSVDWVGDNQANPNSRSKAKSKPVRVGLVFQQPMLFPHVDVKGNLALAQRHAGEKALSIDHALAGCECEHLLHKPIDSLSGGEAQRAALARALVNGPDVLMLDESLSALDAALRSKILRFLVETCKRLNIKLIMVSHDVQDLALFCDGLVAIVDGVITAAGEVAYVMAQIASQGTLENPCAILEGKVMPSTDDFPHPFTRLDFSGNILYAKSIYANSMHVKPKQAKSIESTVACSTVSSAESFTVSSTVNKSDTQNAELGKIAVFASEVSIDTNTQINTPSSSILNALPCEIMEIYQPDGLQGSTLSHLGQPLPPTQLQTAIVVLSHDSQTLYARVSTLSIERLELKPGLNVVARFKLQ